ncbi:MAG TPA: hypothetical protein VFU43_06995 [Streptosporangiaceae bacterium]|nr:hypothetical protein [Streptosporangiaceae bacterium]
MDIPTEHNGTTVTGRLGAQHKLLVALRTELTEFRADYTAFRAEFNAFREETNRRLTALEGMLGQVLHGMTEIKRLLSPQADSP